MILVLYVPTLEEHNCNTMRYLQRQKSCLWTCKTQFEISFADLQESVNFRRSSGMGSHKEMYEKQMNK